MERFDVVKKIQIYTVLAIIIVLAISASLIYFVDGTTIDKVKHFEMYENTENSVTINWKKVHKAQGYRIYSLDESSNEFKKIADIESPKECTYKIENLDGGTVYKLKATAYKTFLKNEYESDESDVITAYTMPNTPNTAVYSENEGILNIRWKQDGNAEGYLVEYSLNEDFSDSKTVETTEFNFKQESLKPKDVYYVRCKSYITVDGKMVYSQWSEPKSVEIMDKIIMPSDIDPSKPMVALTFDDGPGYADKNNNITTKQILDVLEKYGARATFFMCGSRINGSNEDLLKRELELGCELGNHTYDHTHYGKKVTAEDISKCSEKIKDASGQYPTVFRCPGGIMSNEIQKECKKENLPIVYWSVDTEDWKSKDVKSVFKNATNKVYDGSIILMHDIYPSTVQAVEKIVPKLIKDGYQLVTVSEMIEAKNDGKAPQAGQQYTDAKTINNNT